MSIVAASGEVLSIVDTLSKDGHEDAAYAACEHALNAGRILRDGVKCRIALYNPYSAEISYLPAPDSLVFGCEEALSVNPEGSLAYVENNGESIRLNEKTIYSKNLTVAQATRAWEATETHTEK